MKKHVFRHHLLALCALICGLYLVCSNYDMAQAETETQSAADFVVKPVIPANQEDKNLNYFDIKVDPGQQQVLEVEVKNLRDHAITILPKLNVATTNYNGVVNYLSKGQADRTLAHRITDIAHLEANTYTIEPKSSTLVKITMAAPEQPFSGLIAGGISFRQKQDDTTNNNSKQNNRTSLTINNRFSYAMALLLRSNTGAAVVAPNLKMGQVDLGHITAKNTIFANVRNVTPTYLSNVTVNTHVTRKGESDVLYRNRKGNMQIAPNSILPFPVQLNNQKFEPGQYTARVTVKSGTQTWRFNRDFRITAEAARKLNEADSTPQPKDNRWLIWVAAGIILLVILAAILIYQMKQKKLKAQLQRERRAMRKANYRTDK
ncbi:DUF916 and DUF3324 domain-containing protein [Lactobacillus sp. CC-MHH1034]|uniref:DUF916 and DUF3324 domain-containing protein n=1 Tax=Agrilactobacillus fermenti TaxID=2586909 RepID=UPI001E396546|nr:DUF916 and DUF3324 domain-containing protein [Agrilactobacillus fermenti]MCD2256533.1 DUF916 and DUF3324 domain-containing protein [Agrilactobacillus fermenti]